MATLAAAANQLATAGWVGRGGTDLGMVDGKIPEW
jgi:hypothetical protein